MSMEFSQISVPLGGGLQRSVHRWKVKPPAALEAQNVHFRAGESLTKRDQYLDTAYIGVGRVSDILVPQDRAMLLLNNRGAHIIPDKLVHSQTRGFHVPTEVKSHSLLMFRGAVAAPQIAYNNGLFGVVYTEADPDTGRAAVLLVVNERFEVIDGPIRFPDLAWYPRIEALGDGFALFGMSLTSGSLSPEGSLVELACAEWRMGMTVGPSVLMKVEMPSASAVREEWIVVYDTCPGPSDHSCVLVAAHSTSNLPDERAPVVQVIEPGIVVRDSFQLWPGWIPTPETEDRGQSIAVWYDEESDTVLVYSEAVISSAPRRHLYTTSLDMNVPVTKTDMPELSGRYPVFYGNEGLMRVRLNDVLIQCTGDSSRSIVHTVPDGFDRPLHIRPQPRGGTDYCFFQEYTKEEVSLVGGPSSVYTVSDWYAPIGPYGVTVSPLHVGRLPLWRQARFQADTRWGSEGTNRGVVGQSVRVGNSVLIAQFVANAAYLPPPLWTEDSASVSGGTPNFWHSASVTDYVHYRMGGAGVNEGTEQLVITEIKLDSPNYSYVDYYGTAIIAAGGLSGFDGVENIPITLEAPRNVRTEVSTYRKGAAGWPPPGIDNIYTSSDTQLWLPSDSKIELKGVLVYIDRNGIKYRSPSFDMEPIENTTHEAQYCFPEFWFDLPFSVSSAALGKNRLVLEVYTTDIMDVKDDADGAEFHLMFRGGVQWDANEKMAYVDATTFFALRSEYDYWNAWEFNPTPLYTESGELPPAIPPASNVLTQAGNFLFLAPSEDPFTVWHSKPLDTRIGPEFSPLLTLTAPPESGGIVSLAGESDRLLLLCKKGVWELFVGGEAPDIYGNGAFPPYRKLWGGEGCIGHRGTVSGLFGTFFLSDSGPKIVGRDGSVSDISRDLGADLSQVIRAVYHSEDQEIWLFTPEEAFVFDLASNQWSTATLKTKAAAYRDGVMFRLHPDTMMLMSASKGERGYETVYAKYVSPWLSLSGPMDYKRLQEVSVLIDLPRGEATGKEGGIRVSIAYDYKDVEVDVREWHLLDMLDLDLPVQLKVRPTKQKADAYRITVEEFGTGGYSDDNEEHPDTSDLEWSLVDISLNVAAKGGLVKLQSEAKK